MRLLVVMPVYNEGSSIKKVVDEWIFELDKYKFKYKILAINDGSTDNTLNILNNTKVKNLIVIDNKNIGHGKSCILGYQYSLTKNFTHVLQIDSDGQCDPKYFKYLYKYSNTHNAVYGYRSIRDDGLHRKFFTRVLELLIFFKLFTFIKDPNSPYRIIKTKVLKNIMHKIPKIIILANISITVELNKRYKILYLPIRFKKRYLGKSKFNFFSMFRSLLNLLAYIK